MPDPLFFKHVQEQEHSDLLWIICSHIDIPPGKFAQSHIFRSIEGDKLFLNCPQNQWYQKGVPGLGSNIDELVANIRQLVEDCAYSRTIVIGHSMGAYLSIILGNSLDDAEYLATSPELSLCLPGSRSEFHRVKPDKKWSNLDLSSHRHGKGVVVFGIFDPIDAYFSARTSVTRSSSAVIREVYFDHGITEHLTKNRIYQNLLSDIADKGISAVQDYNGILSPQNLVSSETELSLLYEIAHGTPGSNRFSILKQNEDTIYTTINAGLRYHASKLYFQKGDIENALRFSLGAVLLSPFIPYIYRDHLILSKRLGMKEHLNSMYKMFEKQYRNHPIFGNALDKLRRISSSRARPNNIPKEMLTNLFQFTGINDSSEFSALIEQLEKTKRIGATETENLTIDEKYRMLIYSQLNGSASEKMITPMALAKYVHELGAYHIMDTITLSNPAQIRLLKKSLVCCENLDYCLNTIEFLADSGRLRETDLIEAFRSMQSIQRIGEFSEGIERLAWKHIKKTRIVASMINILLSTGKRRAALSIAEQCDPESHLGFSDLFEKILPTIADKRV